MKQFTVKRAVEAWKWIHNNAHHEAGYEYHPITTELTHVFFRNHHEKMRVPAQLYRDEVSKGVTPNKRAFDTRMFALTRAAKMQVTR